MAPTSPSASASYKKKDGTLAISSDLQSITWTPKNGSDSLLSLQTASVTSMLPAAPRCYEQQTWGAGVMILLANMEDCLDQTYSRLLLITRRLC